MLKFTNGPWRWIGNTLAAGAKGTHLMAVEEAPGLGEEAKGNAALVVSASSMYLALKGLLEAAHVDSEGDFLLYRESDADGQEIGPPPSIVAARALLEQIEMAGAAR